MTLALPRRSLILGGAALLAAPAVLRAQVPMTGAGLGVPSGLKGLQNNLSAFWSLEEASGNAADDTANANTLTQTNNPVSTTGVVGNARAFVRASSQSLTRASTASLQTGNIDYSFSFWVKLTSKPASADGMIFLNKGSQVNNQVEYQIFWDQPTDRIKFEVYDGNTTQRGSVAANNLGSPATATWYNIVCWHSAGGAQIGIVVNNGTANTVATSGATGSNAQQFTMAVNWTFPGSSNGFLDGVIDQCGFWQNRVLNSTDISNLYNGGAGLSYAAML